MKLARILLLLTGTILGGIGVVGLFAELEFGDLGWLAVWLTGAVVAHDAVLAPVALAAGTALWWATRRAPRTVRRVVTGGAAVGALLALFAWPLIARQDAVTNDTALPQRYGTNLLLLLALTAATTVVLAGIAWLRARSDRLG